MKKLNILGTEYDYYEVGEYDEKLQGSSGGIACFTENYIAINIDNDSENDVERIKRHEIWHAIFKESGLGDYSSNETLIDFLAAQYTKFEKIYNEIRNVR